MKPLAPVEMTILLAVWWSGKELAVRVWVDFGDGRGLLDYSAALVASVAPDIQTGVEAFRIERRRGAYARCVGALDCGAQGLDVPVAGARLLVKSDAGAALFDGYLNEVRRGLDAGDASPSPVQFMALEAAFLENAAVDASLVSASAVTHAVPLEAVRLHESAHAAEQAGDVTVVGAASAGAYVTELFQGDGTTTTFALLEKPFAAAGGGTLLAENFAESSLDAAVWRVVDGGAHVGLGAGGLRLAGGSGYDGQVVLRSLASVELGGTLLAEMRGVLLQAGSDGVLLGLYANAVLRANCVAGVRVKAAGGAQSLVALVDGAEVGTTFAWSAGHSYTLRVRLHCAAMQRVMATYQAVVNGAVQSFGGGLVDAPIQMVVEVLDEGLASSTPATVLWAGAVSSSVAQAVFAPVNSASLTGSVAGCSLRQQGSAWVTVTTTDGTVTVQRPGTVDAGEDYALHASSVVFFPGRVPAPGELITVRYRRGEPAIARVRDEAAVALAQQRGLPGIRAKTVAVTGPEPRSAADCAAAAQALLAFYGGAGFGVSGVCSLPDASVQAGDLISLPLGRDAVVAPVTAVRVSSAHAAPEVMAAAVSFGQESANGLSFAVASASVGDVAVQAADAVGSLPGLSVVVASASALQVDAGTDAPVGGGFEVRRWDGGWGLSDDALVLRSPVRSFSVPRVAFAERFFVRMFDGSSPAVFGGTSSVVVTHVAVA